MAMALSMSAMMVGTAGPFFFAFGRDTRRPAATAVVVAVYVAVWAAIGAAVDVLMSHLMLPSSTILAAVALAFAAAYMLTPWSRRARTRCREMCGHELRGSALREAATYSASCVVCSAGMMAAVVVLGMTNVLILAGGAAVMLLYKLS